MSSYRTITIHRAAPPKPKLGATCNGCGVCCLAEPCPVGILVSRRRAGACKALRWIQSESRYRCGVVDEPRAFLPRWLPARAIGADRVLARLVLRMIAAGRGCDSDATIE